MQSLLRARPIIALWTLRTWNKNLILYKASYLCAVQHLWARTTQCEPCPSGSFASSSGGATCNLCAQGTYQPDTAQTSCIPCSASQSTVLQGATSAADCVDSSTPNPTGSESFSDANKLVVGTLLLCSSPRDELDRL